MKKFSKILILAILIWATVLQPAASLQASASEETFRYDPTGDGISSAYYHIDREKGFITGIAPGTTGEHLAKVCLPNDICTSQEVIATGTVITSASAQDSLTAVVSGDLNGDGAVTISDLLMVKSYILGNPLPDIALSAGDVSYDGCVTITDFLKIKATLLGLGSISAGRPAGSAGTDELMVLAPEASEIWGVSAASYCVDDETIASVDPSGTVTAKAVEGSTFVYALDGEGVLLSRAMVTVLEGGVTVSLEAKSFTLFPGQSIALAPKLNHPVDTAVSWGSSDSSIASVTPEGVLTGHSPGTTTICVFLPNGSRGEARVTVVTPISGMEFEKSLYKVKPGCARALTLNLTPADTTDELLWTSSDPAIATVSSDGTVTGVNYGTVTITATGRYSGVSASCSVKVCDVKMVAITFDDGPSIYTPALLDFLAENEIPATFFLVVERVPTYQDTVVRIVSEGHELGYHSYSHHNQRALSTERIVGDYEKSTAMVLELTGQGFTVWRTPGGNYDQRVLDSVPLPHILWSVDTRDWETRNTQSVYRRIITGSKDGSIILLHDLYKTSVDGAILAMTEMLAGDYEFVTVTELLSRDGTPPEISTTYRSG